MAATDAREDVRLGNCNTGISKPTLEGREAGHEKCGVRLFGRMEVRIDTKVNAELSPLKPGRGKMRDSRRHGYFIQSEEITIKFSREFFAPGRDGNLNVVQPVNRSGVHDGLDSLRLDWSADHTPNWIRFKLVFFGAFCQHADAI